MFRRYIGKAIFFFIINYHLDLETCSNIGTAHGIIIFDICARAFRKVTNPTKVIEWKRNAAIQCLTMNYDIDLEIILVTHTNYTWNNYTWLLSYWWGTQAGATLWCWRLNKRSTCPKISYPYTQVVDGLTHGVSLTRINASDPGDGRLRADCTQ